MEDTYTRRESICHILENGQKVTARELAGRFSVSVNTIKNDLSVLSKRMKIASVLGRNGGYRFVGESVYRIGETAAEYLRAYMDRHGAEAEDEMYYTVLSELKSKSCS